MEIRNLITFLKVTELQSFSRAADALDYSQSAVTVQIQQLERELNVQLFDRIGKTVSITQYGKDFVAYARDVVSAVSRASSFACDHTQLTGTVRVGTLNSMLTASFSDIVPAFHDRFPHVIAQLHADTIVSLKEKLIKNELDLIYTRDEQVFDTQFVKMFEAEEDIVVVTNIQNPLVRQPVVRLADLVKHPFILMNRSNVYRDLFDRELARQNLTVQPFLELEDDVLALRLIRANPHLSVGFAALHRQQKHPPKRACRHSRCGLRNTAMASGPLPQKQGPHAADPGDARRHSYGCQQTAVIL